MLKITAIIQAAGLSRRMQNLRQQAVCQSAVKQPMGEKPVDKLMLLYNGKTLLQHSIDLLSELPVFERVVVTNEERTAQVTIPPDFKVIINTAPEKGQNESIRLGVEAATGTHYLFLTADQPKLTPGDVLPLLEVAKTNPAKIIHPTVNSGPSSPAIFPEGYRSELLSLSGDTGGRIVRDANKENCIGITAENPGNFIDIDSMEDYNDII